MERSWNYEEIVWIKGAGRSHFPKMASPGAGSISRFSPKDIGTMWQIITSQPDKTKQESPCLFAGIIYIICLLESHGGGWLEEDQRWVRMQ
jgi:hypothetical protein